MKQLIGILISLQKKNTKLKIYFNQNLMNLESFFDSDCDPNFNHLISADFCHFDTSSVTTMFGMFNGSTSLRTLYLSNFNTSSVTNMDEMFSGCSSLKYLIISNFNFDKIIYNEDYGYTGIDGIFEDLLKLEYIDIYSIKDSRKLLNTQMDELNEKDNLTVCNNSVIITNPHAIYDCLNNNYFIDDILVCNNIQTTIPLIQTTIPQIHTINPIIKTTNPQIQTTNPIIQTTNPKIQTTSPEITNEGTILILLGFNYFKLNSSTIFFNVLFAKILNDIYSNLMKVLLIVNYNERIRILEEKEIDCYLKKTKNTNIAAYFCQTKKFEY